MPKDSGNRAPPTPWTTRATISTPMVGASAASRQPSARAASENGDQRALLADHVADPAEDRREDRRPTAGRRSSPRSRCTGRCAGRAGRSAAPARPATAACENTPAPAARTAKVRRVDVRGMKSLSGQDAARSSGHGRTGRAGCGAASGTPTTATAVAEWTFGGGAVRAVHRTLRRGIEDGGTSEPATRAAARVHAERTPTESGGTPPL